MCKIHICKELYKDIMDDLNAIYIFACEHYLDSLECETEELLKLVRSSRCVFTQGELLFILGFLDEWLPLI